MAIEILRLRSGEDIMCDISEETAAEYSVENPAVIMPMGRTEGGAVQIALSPWMPYSTSTTFTIPKDFVVTSAFPSEEIAGTYAEMYSTVFVPKQQILM